MDYAFLYEAEYNICLLFIFTGVNYLSSAAFDVQ